MCDFSANLTNNKNLRSDFSLFESIEYYLSYSNSLNNNLGPPSPEPPFLCSIFSSSVFTNARSLILFGILTKYSTMCGID